jgi:hypothetical protein
LPSYSSDSLAYRFVARFTLQSAHAQARLTTTYAYRSRLPPRVLQPDHLLSFRGCLSSCSTTPHTKLLQHFQIGTAHSGLPVPLPDILVAARRGYPGYLTRVSERLRQLFFLQHWAPLAVTVGAPQLCLYPSREASSIPSCPNRNIALSLPTTTISPTTATNRFRPVSYYLLHLSLRCRIQASLLLYICGLLHSTDDTPPDSCAAPPNQSQACKLANYATPPVSPLGYRALEPPFSLQLKSRLGGMDNDRRSRQNPSGYASQQGTLLPPQASYPVVSASDRYRQAPLTAPAPPTSASAPPSHSRGSSSGYGYAYGEGAQFGSSIQSSYGAQDYSTGQQPSPQRAAQQYSPYGQSVMYGVGGAQGSASGSSQYEPVEQYQQNRDSAIQVLSTGFGVAQAPYYESGPTSAPTSTLASQTVPSQYPSLGYTASQAPVGRETLAPAYSTAGMSDHNQATAGYSQGSFNEQPGAGNEFDVFYNRYQTELKRTFEHVRDGQLSEAAQQLYMLSDWVLHYAETLGESF